MEKSLRPSLVFTSKAKYQMITSASLKNNLLGTNNIACSCCSICDKEKSLARLIESMLHLFFFETEPNKLERIFHGKVFKA
jgi:hypothetical protein